MEEMEFLPTPPLPDERWMDELPTQQKRGAPPPTRPSPFPSLPFCPSSSPQSFRDRPKVRPCQCGPAAGGRKDDTFRKASMGAQCPVEPPAVFVVDS
uniref:Uncharacterized protein n=1 Tax=Globodera rostochiensis TaxID=31243 RepID=A0A914HJD4_GLORO